jgi:hypothetical protein
MYLINHDNIRDKTRRRTKENKEVKNTNPTCLFCLGPLVFLLTKIIKLFGFPCVFGKYLPSPPWQGWLAVVEYLCHKWPRMCSTCRKHSPVLSSFMTYHRVCYQINTTGASSGARTAYPSWAPEILRLVCPVSLGCPFLIAPTVFSNVYLCA